MSLSDVLNMVQDVHELSIMIEQRRIDRLPTTRHELPCEGHEYRSAAQA